MAPLACVFAHPDDETYAVGGTLASYAARGIHSDIFCATNGDAGKSSGVPVSSRAELGKRRLAELRAAANVLGVETIVATEHPDGALAEVNTELLVGQIVEFLRRSRPAVVLTFGPEGAPTGHRDHRAISRAATAAFHLAGLATEYPEQLERGVAPHAPRRLFYVAWDGVEDAGPGRPPRASVPPTARIRVRDFMPAKGAAFDAHATQHVHRAAFESAAIRDVESYALAAGAAQRRPTIDDLFDGL